MLKTYGAAPYGAELKKLEKQIKEKQTSVNEKIGVKVMILVDMGVISSDSVRNLIPDWHHHIYGTLQQIDSGCRRSSLYK